MGLSEIIGLWVLAVTILVVGATIMFGAIMVAEWYRRRREPQRTRYCVDDDGRDGYRPDDRV
jgi:hypothetical protein